MVIDYDLNRHYESGDDLSEISEHGYTVKFHTDRILEYVREKYGIIAEKHKRYRFTDDELFKELRENLSNKDTHFSGLYGSDDWVLYALRHKDYWTSIYGDDFFEKNYPEKGIEIWNNSEKLKIEKHGKSGK